MIKLSPTLLLSLCFLFCGQARAAIEFIYGVKERTYCQNGNTPPQIPVEWSFGVGASGDNQLTAVAVTPLGSATPIDLVGDGGSFDLENEGFSNKAELDSAYPNGNLSFSVTDNGNPQMLGPFSVIGDAYPEIPYFTNVLNLHSHDLAQSFELTWNPFTGADEGDQVLLQVRNVMTDDEPIFEFLPHTATSYEFSGGTFEANNAYDIDLIFINETDGLESSETIIGYLSSTKFILTTFTSDTSLGFFKIKSHQQNTSENVQDNGYRAITTVTGSSNTVGYAEIQTQGGIHSLNAIASNAYLLTEMFETKEQLDGSYPTGEVSFGLSENESSIRYGAYCLSGDAYPEPPLFENFSELLSFDASQDKSISWTAPPPEVNQVDLLVFDGSGMTVWTHNAAPGATNAILPANTLAQDNQYRLVVRFRVPTLTSENPPVTIGYISATSLPFQTSADGGGDPGIQFIYTIKEQSFIQEGGSAPTTPVRWSFNAGVDGGFNVTGGSISHPGGSEAFTGEFGGFGTQGHEHPSLEALNADVPNGQFNLTVFVDGTSQPLGPFNLSGDAYPPAPHILNAGDLASHDLSQPFTLNWSAFTGFDADDRIVIEVENFTAREEVVFEFLAPESTSYQFPGGSFAEGNQYEISILFVNETDGLETPETIIGYISRTKSILSLLTTDTELNFFKLRRYQQTSADEAQIDGYRPFGQVMGHSNSVTFAEIRTRVSFNPLTNISTNLHLLVPPFGSKELLDAEFPAGEIYFRVEENESSIDFAPYLFPPDDYPSPALIQNFDELQRFDASLDQEITWSAAPSEVTKVLVRILDASSGIVWSTEMDSSATSVVLPAKTLSQFSDFTLLVGFWARKTGSENPDASLGFTTSTHMAIETFTNTIDFPTWQALRFKEEQLPHPEIVGENADPDGDRLSNYLEFLLGTNPNESPTRNLYRMSDGPGHILIIGPIPSHATWELRSSTDLTNWGLLDEQFFTIVGDEIHVNLDAVPTPTFLQLALLDN